MVLKTELCRFSGSKIYPGKGIRFVRSDSQDIHAEAVKKRRRTTKKPYSRSIVGATLEVIQKKRTEKPEVRDAAREAALREIKERIKKTKDEKKAKKAETIAKTQKTQTKSGPKGAAPKGAKLGGGGKR
ncbi:60S ribosomal protein [Musa troglodytarum]|uniref:60S ribosomal protein n=1 Tax=Musa troglodytarum TaxID=320322 RepID=A0A9E7HWN1_9LILI|nr:60S ribosomal protein [Musa troglodytarum]